MRELGTCCSFYNTQGIERGKQKLNYRDVFDIWCFQLIYLADLSNWLSDVRCILCYFCICLLLHFYIWWVFFYSCEQCNFFFWRSIKFSCVLLWQEWANLGREWKRDFLLSGVALIDDPGLGVTPMESLVLLSSPVPQLSAIREGGLTGVSTMSRLAWVASVHASVYRKKKCFYHTRYH